MRDLKIEELRQAINVILTNSSMVAEFKQILGEVPVREFLLAVSAGIVKDNVIEEVMRIAPTCYAINGKTFLKGEEKGKYDFIGDGMDEFTVTELYDMTTEMDSGESYSFYVSCTKYFEYASVKETVRVKEFLNNL